MRLRSNTIQPPVCQCNHWQLSKELLPNLQFLINKLPLLEGKQDLNPCGIDACPIVNCLHCEKRLCSRDSQSVDQHYKETGHKVGVENGVYWTHVTNVRCFQCDATIDFIVYIGKSEEYAIPLKLTSTVHQKDEEQCLRGLRKTIPDKISKAVKGATYRPVYKRGLVNLSQTCYMNCIVQILVHTKVISRFFMENTWRIKRKMGGANGTSTMTGTLYELIKNVFESTPIVPTDLLYISWTKMPQVGGNRQHDAHEYFMALIYVLHVELLDKMPLTTPGMEEESFIDKIFQGKLKSEIVCGTCRHSRFKVDPVWDLSLEMSSSQTFTKLTALLEQFTQVEHLEDGNSLTCNTCNKVTKSTRQLSFGKLPEILCIHLKRFRHKMTPSNGNQFIKIGTKVDVPHRLDLDPYTSAIEILTSPKKDTLAIHPLLKKSQIYHLHAFVKHTGTYESGHYRTYMCDQGYWYLFDDAKVSRVTFEEALKQAQDGYILFYKKPCSVFCR